LTINSREWQSSKYSTSYFHPVKRTRKRIRIQLRAVKMAILAPIMKKRHLGTDQTKKTAQKERMEVMEMMKEARELIKAIRTQDRVIKDRVAAVKQTVDRMKDLMEDQATQIRDLNQEQGKAQVERVLLRNRILDLEQGLARLITANQVK
jgi:hypothetical protein